MNIKVKIEYLINPSALYRIEFGNTVLVDSLPKIDKTRSIVSAESKAVRLK